MRRQTLRGAFGKFLGKRLFWKQACQGFPGFVKLGFGGDFREDFGVSPCIIRLIFYATLPPGMSWSKKVSLDKFLSVCYFKSRNFFQSPYLQRREDTDGISKSQRQSPDYLTGQGP